jgi:hypothetical protein
LTADPAAAAHGLEQCAPIADALLHWLLPAPPPAAERDLAVRATAGLALGTMLKLPGVAPVFGADGGVRAQRALQGLLQLAAELEGPTRQWASVNATLSLLKLGGTAAALGPVAGLLGPQTLAVVVQVGGAAQTPFVSFRRACLCGRCDCEFAFVPRVLLVTNEESEAARTPWVCSGLPRPGREPRPRPKAASCCRRRCWTCSQAWPPSRRRPPRPSAWGWACS